MIMSSWSLRAPHSGPTTITITMIITVVITTIITATVIVTIIIITITPHLRAPRPGPGLAL